MPIHIGKGRSLHSVVSNVNFFQKHLQPELMFYQPFFFKHRNIYTRKLTITLTLNRGHSQKNSLLRFHGLVLLIQGGRGFRKEGVSGKSSVFLFSLSLPLSLSLSLSV